MMDAVEYLREKVRMCKSHIDCDRCQLREKKEESNSCYTFEIQHPKESVSIVEKWSREHPVMTNAMKFEEVFGTVQAVKDGPISQEFYKWLIKPYKEPEVEECN